MPRPRKTRRLGVWMNGEAIGAWTLGAQGQHIFAYSDGWLTSPHVRPLSLSMPLRSASNPYRGDIVEAFFDNLLPDNRVIRQRIQSRFHTASIRAFDLLTEIGRDCVGAIQLLPDGDIPQNVGRIESEPLTEAGVAAILRATTAPAQNAYGAHDFRISLAGAQEKTALLLHQGAWHRPIGATPTTHIFKLPLGQRVGYSQADMSTSVENEWLCSQIVRAYGLPVAHCQMASFEGYKALVVERFDRRLSESGTYWLRLPQEDACQALGVPPSLKYEADGGPGIKRIMDLLLGSQHAEGDRLTFYKAQCVYWMLCAPDGHAKNFSLAIESGGRYRLTPLYDILSVWPVLGHGANQLVPKRVKMAMALVSKNRHYAWAGSHLRHWLTTAQACGLDRATAQSAMEELTASTPRVIADVETLLPDDFPASVSDPILQGLDAAAQRFVA